MLKIYGRRHKVKPTEWKQSCEILHGGVVVGFVERVITLSADVTRTRNMKGEVVEGERLDWLLEPTHS